MLSQNRQKDNIHTLTKVDSKDNLQIITNVDSKNNLQTLTKVDAVKTTYNSQNKLRKVKGQDIR